MLLLLNWSWCWWVVASGFSTDYMEISSMLPSVEGRAEISNSVFTKKILTDLHLLKKFEVEIYLHCFWLFMVFQSRLDVHKGSDKMLNCTEVPRKAHVIWTSIWSWALKIAVKEVPILRLRFSKGSFLFVTLSKDGIHTDKTVLHAFSQEMDTTRKPFERKLSFPTPSFQIVPLQSPRPCLILALKSPR